MTLKDAVENLKKANDAIEASNELADADRIRLLQQLNVMLVNLIIALIAKL